MRFFCIGAQRCGTFWLYDMMRQHPDVIVPKYKEPHFFDREYKKGLPWYNAQLRSVGHKPVGDFTATYLFHPYSIHLIYKHYPDAKIIVMLRDPTLRAYSHWALFHYGNQEHADTPDKRTFWEAITDEVRGTYRTNWETAYVSRGFYAEQLYRVMYLFPVENIMVLRYSDLFTKKRQLFDRVCEFIGVSGKQVPNFKLDKRINQRSSEAKGPEPEAENFLREIYARPNEELCNLLGRDMGWPV